LSVVWSAFVGLPTKIQHDYKKQQHKFRDRRQDAISNVAIKMDPRSTFRLLADDFDIHDHTVTLV
jgi:hypothetical protein